jgi:hypothetical protein
MVVHIGFPFEAKEHPERAVPKLDQVIRDAEAVVKTVEPHSVCPFG